VNYQTGMRAELALMPDINAVFHGQIGEQIAGQTLLALNVLRNNNLHYWYRDQNGATSEVDYLIISNERLLPVEVKSGKTGTLRSLHNFIDESKCDFAIRVYSGNMHLEQLKTARGKKSHFFPYHFTFYSGLMSLIFK
jgi:uncharacterized protein